MPVVGEVLAGALAVAELGKLFGWWGGRPQFTGNVRASETGKIVPPSAPIVYLPNVAPPSYDPPIGIDIFHCPGCAETWNNADTTVHGLAIATGGVAAAPFAAPAAAYAAEAASPYAATGVRVGIQLMQELALNPSTWTNVGDFVSGWIPTADVPATAGGFSGVVTNQVYEWWNNR